MFVEMCVLCVKKSHGVMKGDATVYYKGVMVCHHKEVLQCMCT